MKRYLLAVAAMMMPGVVHAQAVQTSTNGAVRIGVNPTGELNGGSPYTGIAYNFTGQGGRTGFQDALTPGCPCEAWGVAANGIEGQVGQSTGNTNISLISSSAGVGSFTSLTSLGSLAGLTVKQTYSQATMTATGALFVDNVTIHNGTGALVTDLRYARAMDWDVPPTEFSEYSTFKGTGTTSTLLRSTDDGFAAALPISGMSNSGYSSGVVNHDGSFGPTDHGAFFIFGFGNLASGADYNFNIYYGAGANEADALTLLSNVSPELYNLGQSNSDGARATTLPTFVFAFSGVGGSVVVPPTTGAVPEPATWAMMIVGVGAVGGSLRRRRAAVATQATLA